MANADPELFLIGTSEVALAGLHMSEIVPEEELPLRYCGRYLDTDDPIMAAFLRQRGTP